MGERFAISSTLAPGKSLHKRFYLQVREPMFQMERAIRSGFFTLAAAEAPRIRKTARHTIQRLSRIARYKYRYQPGKPSKMNSNCLTPMTTHTASTSTAFRLPTRLLQVIDRWCDDNDTTRSQFFRRSIMDRVKLLGIGCVAE